MFPGLKMSLGPTSGGDTPSYPNQSRSNNNKLDRKRLDSSAGTFIELDDRTESQVELERALERKSIASHGSETPIHEKLVPYNGEKGYGCLAKANVKDIEDHRVRTVSGDGIVMTKTVEQSRQNMV